MGFPVDEGDAQVVVEAAIADGPASSGLTLYAKYGAPPGAASGQHDARAAWDAVTRNRAVRLTLDRGSEPYRPGEWWVGVVGVGKAVSYELSVSRFSCPFGCSGNGFCNSPAGVCTCVDGFVGAACERQLRNLTWDGVVNVSETEFEYEVYQLDPLPGPLRGVGRRSGQRWLLGARGQKLTREEDRNACGQKLTRARTALAPPLFRFGRAFRGSKAHRAQGTLL